MKSMHGAKGYIRPEGTQRKLTLNSCLRCNVTIFKFYPERLRDYFIFAKYSFILDKM